MIQKTKNIEQSPAQNEIEAVFKTDNVETEKQQSAKHQDIGYGWFVVAGSFICVFQFCTIPFSWYVVVPFLKSKIGRT